MLQVLVHLWIFGDYVISGIEMKSGSEVNGEAIMRELIDNEEYEWYDWLIRFFSPSSFIGDGDNYWFVSKWYWRVMSNDWIWIGHSITHTRNTDSVAFKNVKELSSLSTLVFLIMIEMLIHSTE